MRNNKIKIVIDTNIFIRAFILSNEYQSCVNAMGLILDLIEKDKIELVFSQDTIGELIYMMKNYVSHSDLSDEEQLILMNSLISIIYYSYTVNTEYTKAPECNDKKDYMFLQCAKQSKANYIITDDFKSGMHSIKNIKTKIVSSEQFVKLFDDREFEQVAVE